MDKSEFVKIAVTAIITAFSKEIASGLASLVKRHLAESTATAKIRSALTLNKITVVFNLGLLVFWGVKLYRAVIDPSPLTRLSVFDIALSISLVTLTVARLDMFSLRYLDRVERRREEMAVASELRAVSEAISDTTRQVKAEAEKLRLPPKSPSDGEKN